MEIVRTLVESAPDRVVGRLQRALAESSDYATFADVRQVVEAEARDRELRDSVFAPLAPLCIGDGSDPDRLTFPAEILGLLWRGLKATAPRAIARALTAAETAELAIASQMRPEDPAYAYDALIAKCAEAVRALTRALLFTAQRYTECRAESNDIVSVRTKTRRMVF